MTDLPQKSRLRLGMWMSMALLAGLVAGYVIRWAQVPRSLPEAMLAAVQTPRSGQFAQPEAVVQFFLEQVKHQDIDQATRAFPIRERYQRNSFALWTRRLQAIDVRGSPLPGAPYHNAIVALDPLFLFEHVSLRLMDMDASRIRTDIPSPPSANDLERLASEYDPARLATMRIESTVLDRFVPLDASDEYYKAMHISKRAIVKSAVARDDKHYRCTFIVEQIDDQWRIAVAEVEP
jgi:hypothetical protein